MLGRTELVPGQGSGPGLPEENRATSRNHTATLLQKGDIRMLGRTSGLLPGIRPWSRGFSRVATDRGATIVYIHILGATRGIELRGPSEKDVAPKLFGPS